MMSWSVEKAKLVGDIYDRHMAVHFSSYGSLAELAEAWPDGHYVWVVHERLEPLVNAFERLWLLDRMLRIDDLPLRGADNAFVSRAEWLRLTHELILVRISAIRDLCALLVASVYEINIPIREVNLGRLRQREVSDHPELCEVLRKIADAAADVRDERNTQVHQGIRRAFGEYQMFDTASHMEALTGNEPVFKNIGDSGEPFTLPSEHARIATELRTEFESAADELQTVVMAMLDLLHGEWIERFERKVSLRRTDAVEED